MSSPATPVVVRQNSPDLGGGDSPVCMTPLMVRHSRLSFGCTLESITPAIRYLLFTAIHGQLLVMETLYFRLAGPCAGDDNWQICSERPHRSDSFKFLSNRLISFLSSISFGSLQHLHDFARSWGPLRVALWAPGECSS